MKVTEELRWRGMIRDVMPGTAEQPVKEMTTGYVGFHPTADSLHIGSLVPILRPVRKNYDLVRVVPADLR